MNRETRRNIERVLRSGLSPRRHSPIAPEQEAALLHEIRQQITSLQTDAGLHAWTGADADRILHYVGRLIYMALFAAARWSTHLAASAEFIAVRTLAETISQLQTDATRLEALRPEIQSGMLALARLLEALPALDLAVASAEQQMQLERCQSMAIVHRRRARL